MELFEFEQNDIEDTLIEMEQEYSSLDIEIMKAQEQVDKLSLLNVDERDHDHFLEIRNLASSIREQILQLRSVLRSWREYLQAPLKLRTLLPDDSPLHANYARLRWQHRKLSVKLAEQTYKLDNGNGLTGILLELQRLKPASVRKEDSEGSALKALAMNGTNAWDSASVWKLYENVRSALEEIAGGPEMLQNWEYCHEDIMEVGLSSIQDFRAHNLDSLEKLNEFIELKLSN
ncbi:MAG: hypothetical protein ACI9S8_001107 [Chlamydiales bacterium]|jgi:hypothetical protein